MTRASEDVQGEALDRELAGLLDVETFEPSPEFRSQATLSDPAVYEEAARDPQGWWARQAEQLHWFRKWDTVLEDSNPPFYKWFGGGHAGGARCLGPASGTRCSRPPPRRSTSGSWGATSTPPTPAWTATCSPV